MSEKQKLLHEHITFGAYGEEGGAHAIVTEGDRRVYFRIGSAHAGVSGDVGGEISVADAEKLIGLLRRATDAVKAEIVRQDALLVARPCPKCGPRGDVRTEPDLAGYEFITSCRNCYDAEITEDGPVSSSMAGHGKTRAASISDWNERVEEAPGSKRP